MLALETAQGALCYMEYPYPPKVCLVLGNESKGVYASTLAHCDGAVFIPMYGKGPSLNVHVAGALVAYQALFGRRYTIGDSCTHRDFGTGLDNPNRSLLED